MSSQWSALGWQHLYMETPPDWSLGAVNGDHAAGYLRVDDAEMPRLEVRWEQAKGQEPVERVVERYLSTLMKKSRRKAPPVKIRRDLSLLKGVDKKEEGAAECFHWRTRGDEALQAYGLLRRCPHCARIVFLQVMARAGETILPVAVRVLNSLRDHPAGETAVWAVYGMRMEIPAAYFLKDYRFLTGRIALRFSGEKDTLEVERLSLAETQLEGRAFAAWFQETGEGDTREQEVLTDGAGRHEMVIASGVTPDPDRANRRFTWLPWRRPARRHFDRCGWHCPQNNKLFTIRRLGDTGDRACVLRIAGRIACH